MKKDNIFSIVAMGCGLLLIISIFLPYVTYYSTSLSLWKMEDSSRVIYILLGLLVIGLYLINKKTELSYLTAGFGIFSTIGQIIALEGFNGLSIGFYLILLSSLSIAIMTFLYDEKEAIALINLSVSVNKPVVNNNQPMSQQVINNQPIQSQPIINEPVVSEPQIVEQPKPLRFDPMTGQPIYQDNNELH